MSVSTALQLEIYNDALTEHLGERQLANLTENVEARRVLDQFWRGGRFIDECLEEGSWTFATRTQQIYYDPSIEPDYGFPYAYPKPDDFKRLVAISNDGNFYTRLDEAGYADENGYWFTWGQEIYVKFVSNDESYGLDTSKWPESFLDFVKVRLANKACARITQSESKKEMLDKKERKLMLNARGKDGMNKPSVQMGRGNWNNARNISRGSRSGNY